MGREQVIPSNKPRESALQYVTGNGQHTLRVEKFLEAARPSGEEAYSSFVTKYPAPDGKLKYAPAIKGVSGHVIETGQSFTIRDDFDFANPSASGKGYHVNVQLGKDTVAFTSGQYSTAQYFDRVSMTGERLHGDGARDAASWYTQGYSR
ncbi:hypothetical protein PMG11_03331 [Penicillium brasilianum]|uniref:Uncharacterized protein n=1 Tax=Penicillium brasilianum TaxID=104259 RepID=A0A0F7VH48_PENBI|nr:hypothetical protein PMG11_03331 [Penicillium brasilianum]